MSKERNLKIGARERAGRKHWARQPGQIGRCRVGDELWLVQPNGKPSGGGSIPAEGFTQEHGGP
jgi:hypothetical protein